ncbi:MAG: MoaD/ThiS family protein [Acidobacteriota bacterium]|nr:MoaD/ThiS family protein [Acidobacteriota bacterium]
MIPGALRQFSANRPEVRIDGDAVTVGEALALLWAECPGARDRVLTERGAVRTHINIFADGENIRYARGLESPVGADAEIIILPAVSGG